MLLARDARTGLELLDHLHLGDTIDQPGDARAELRFNLPEFDSAVFYYVVQNGSGNRFMVEIEINQDVCHGK